VNVDVVLHIYDALINRTDLREMKTIAVAAE